MPAKQQRRIIFFLGAGASYGAGASVPIQGGGERRIPTQNTFWETFLRFGRSNQNKNDIESFLFRYFLGYSKAPGRLKRAKRLPKLAHIDVEEVFTFLSERNTAPRISPQFRAYTQNVWKCLVEEIGYVFSRFLPNKKTRSIYRKFKKSHVRSHDTIVSFNYDIVFEYSLSTPWYYGGIEGAHKRGALRVLKPHGSINWKEDGGVIKRARPTYAFPASPIIVAPTHLKFVGDDNGERGDGSLDQSKAGYLNQTKKIADVWRAMENEMRDAKALVFIGYSFPPSDLYFSSVLRSILAVRKEMPYVVVVNPDAMAISGRLNSRFSIPLARIQMFSDLKTFNQIGRDQLIRLFS
jgi:hypothetical protein